MTNKPAHSSIILNRAICRKQDRETVLSKMCDYHFMDVKEQEVFRCLKTTPECDDGALDTAVLISALEKHNMFLATDPGGYITSILASVGGGEIENRISLQIEQWRRHGASMSAQRLIDRLTDPSESVDDAISDHSHDLMLSRPVPIPEWDLDDDSIEKYLTQNAPDIKFIVPGLLASEVVGHISGAGGSYKSFAAMWLCMQRATIRLAPDQKWLGRFPLTFGKSIYFSAEDTERTVWPRMKAILGGLRQEYSHVPEASWVREISDNMKILPREKWIKNGNIHLIQENGKANEDRLDSIVAYTKGVGADLIILDTLSRIHCTDENSNGDAARIIAVLERIRDATGATIIVVSHPPKGGKGIRGAGAFIENARFGMYFERERVKSGDSAGDLLQSIRVSVSKVSECEMSGSFRVGVSWPLFTEPEKDEKAKVDPRKSPIYQVISYLLQNPGGTQRVVQISTGLSEYKAKLAFRTAKEDGLIEKSGKENAAGGYSATETGIAFINELNEQDKKAESLKEW